MMLTIIIFVCSVALFFMALLVLLKNKSSITNILFSLLVFAQMGWIVSNYASLSNYSFIDTLTAVRLILFFVVLLNTLFLLFTRVFPENKYKFNTRKLIGYLLFSAFTAVVTLSPLVFETVELNNGVPITSPGPGMLFFASHATISIFLGFRNLLRKRKGAGKQLSQHINLLLLASILTWIIVPITNFAGTQALNTTLFVQLSPLYTLLFMSIIGYSIVTQKLFDIRALLARSLGYVLVLGSMTQVYLSMVIGIDIVHLPWYNLHVHK